jgi:hypothetical protein
MMGYQTPNIDRIAKSSRVLGEECGQGAQDAFDTRGPKRCVHGPMRSKASHLPAAIPKFPLTTALENKPLNSDS